MPATTRRKMIVAGLLAAALPAALLANHSWGSYHWARTANPFDLKVGNNVTTTAWNSAFDQSIVDWSQSSVLNLTEVAGTVNPKTCKATTGRVQVCNARYGNNGWLGIAGISASGSHITKGYVKLNDTYFNTATYNSAAWRNLVTCQEIGHTLGLDHQDETFDNPNLGTCMDYTNSPNSNQHPNAHDYNQLETIYSHLDSTTTVGALADYVDSATTAGGSQPEGAFAVVDQLDQNHPAAWGRLVHRSPSGGVETYVLDLGNGHRQITVVTWTLEEAARRRAQRAEE